MNIYISIAVAIHRADFIFKSSFEKISIVPLFIATDPRDLLRKVIFTRTLNLQP